MTANRLCDPQSKLGVWERWCETVYLPGAEQLTKNDLYAAMDALHAQAAEVEQAVFFHTADLFKLEVDLLFYDTTTCTFAIDEDDEDELRRFGRPKDGAWAPQVVVAFAVTREGLPVRSWVFPGNTTDATTVERIKDDLRGWKLGRRSVRRRCRDALRGEPRGACPRGGQVRARGADERHYRGQDRGTQPSGTLPHRSRRTCFAKEVVVGDGERRRRYIVCFNPKEAERQAKHRAEVIEALQEELARHKSRQATAKWAMELLTSGRYRRYLKVKGGEVCLEAEAIRQAPRLDGKWVLITNDDTLSIEDAAVAYKSLLVIERCFRSLKRGQIHLGPMYHRLSQRICVFRSKLITNSGRSWTLVPDQSDHRFRGTWTVDQAGISRSEVGRGIFLSQTVACSALLCERVSWPTGGYRCANFVKPCGSPGR